MRLQFGEDVHGVGAVDEPSLLVAVAVVVVVVIVVVVVVVVDGTTAPRSMHACTWWYTEGAGKRCDEGHGTCMHAGA